MKNNHSIDGVKCYLCKRLFETTESQRAHLLFEHGQYTDICYTSDYYSASQRLIVELSETINRTYSYVRYYCLYECNVSASRVWNELPLISRQQIITQTWLEYYTVLQKYLDEFTKKKFGKIPKNARKRMIPVILNYVGKKPISPTEKLAIKKVHSILKRLRMMKTNYTKLDFYKKLRSEGKICTHHHKCKPFNIHDYYINGWKMQLKYEKEYKKLHEWAEKKGIVNKVR